MPPRKPAKRKPSGTPRKRRGVKLKPTQLGATELALDAPPAELAALADAVARRRRAGAGLVPRAARRAPAHARGAAARQVVPTPFQRDISDAHVRRLTQAMDKTQRFLDPIIVVREKTEHGQYWTPNGYHRLTALKELDAKSILALLVPERAVAYQILALNIEKAHNLREKSIGVRRMYVDLAAMPGEAKGRGLRARVRGAGARDARLRLRGARAPLGRRLPRRSCARSTSGCPGARRRHRRAQRARQAAARLRRGRAGRRRRAQGARAHEPLPAQLRRLARQPAALHQGRAAAHRRAPAVDDQARARHEPRQDQAGRRRAHGRAARGGE